MDDLVNAAVDGEARAKVEELSDPFAEGVPDRATQKVPVGPCGLDDPWCGGDDSPSGVAVRGEVVGTAEEEVVHAHGVRPLDVDFIGYRAAPVANGGQGNPG